MAWPLEGPLAAGHFAATGKVKAGRGDAVEIRVKLLPEVRKALTRSGLDINQAINDALMRNIQTEAA